MVTEYTTKAFILRKIFTTIEFSFVTEMRICKVDQVESRSIRRVGGMRCYAYICRFCTVVDDFSIVKISVAIELY